MQDTTLNQKTRSGSLKISAAAVASIVEYTVGDAEGVAGLAPAVKGFSGLFVHRSEQLPVSIQIQDGVAEIRVRIIAEAASKLPQLCNALQASVKEAVQSMTGIVVSKVNVQVVGIHFPGDLQK